MFDLLEVCPKPNPAVAPPVDGVAPKLKPPELEAPGVAPNENPDDCVVVVVVPFIDRQYI